MRICVLLGAIAFGVLAVQATARAADNSGGQQLLQQADTATTNAQALISQEVASSSSAVSAVVGESAASPPAVAPASVSVSAASIESEAMTIVSQTIAAAGADPASGPSPAQPAAAQAAPGGSPPTRARPRAARNRPTPTTERAVGRPEILSQVGTAPTSALSHPTAGHGHGSARAGGEEAVPHRLPPLPAPPQSVGGATQAGGAGTAPPLLVVALAAGLFVIFFDVLSRLLPRSAFRKPRRLALPPWHPG